MQELYSENSLKSLDQQLKRRLYLLGAVSAALLLSVIWSLTVRIEWLTVALLLLLGMILIFCLDLFCRPLWMYKRLVRNALHGRTHTESFIFDHFEPDLSVVDGVRFRSLVFLGEPDKHGTREQMYYWDNELPLPDFEPGSTVSLHYTGKAIIGYEVLRA